MHDRLQDFVHVEPGLRGDLRRIRCLQADHVLDLLDGLIRPGAGQVDLIDDRNDLQVIVQCHVDVPEGLGLDALGRVDHQHRAVAGCQGTGNFIIKIDMPGGVDQVEIVFLAVPGFVDRADRLALNGDAALPLQFHVVQDLVLHLPAREKSGLFNDAVRQGGFAVVDVGDDTEIPDMLPVS